MKKRISKLFMVMAAATIATVGIVGCKNQKAENETDNGASVEDTSNVDNEENEDVALSGSVTMAGSTSMEKVANALSEGFMEKYPDVTVTVEFTGSSAGLESLAAGSVDIGNASRNLKDTEKESGAVENVIAIDGIAVITDAENTVINLSSEELVKIYTGEITNWKELGGEDEQIVVIGREAASGTRGAFEELLEIEDICVYSQELDSTGAVLAKVASTPGAIGYVSLDVVDDTVLALSLDEVEATEENIVAGNYVLSRPFVMATMGEIDDQEETVKAFFEFVQSEEGQNIIKGVGLILPQ